MSSIVTFYSYKGGVGRSMALANIAFELSKRKFKVLIVDWDLEAPGIERYFSSFKIENSSEGLLQLLIAFKEGKSPKYKEYLWQIDTINENPISLLHSGRDKDPAKYSSLLQEFDWSDFFTENKGGHHLEGLRTEWHNDFDFVLIDSRTGLSDSSGICTIMMPDILVPMFTANYQSLFGVRDIVKYIQAARQSLEVDRMALTVLPIPSRFGTRVEFKESIEWLERIADILKDCYSDWLPKWIEPKYILEQIKIPQIDYFSFGEKLAVVEQGTNDPEGMGFIFSKIATLLSTDFGDIENFVGSDYYQTKKKEFEDNNLLSKKQAETEFLYDVYLSYPREVYQWVKELLLPTLEDFLSSELGRKPNIYADFSGIEPGSEWQSTIQNAIQRSRTILLIVSDLGLKSSFFNLELNSVINREIISGKNILFPLLYNYTKEVSYDLLPEIIKSKIALDFNNFNYEETIKNRRLFVQFGQEVEKLSLAVVQTIVNDNLTRKKQPSKKNNVIDNIEKLQQLAKEYEEIRIKMPSSSDRTRVMGTIVNRMKEISNDPTNFLPTLTESSSPGERLAAIAKLQKFPNLEYVNWLANHVGDIEKPFVGYQASVALYIASRAFGKDNKILIEDALKIASKNIEKYEYQDPNQVNVISSALNELNII